MLRNAVPLSSVRFGRVLVWLFAALGVAAAIAIVWVVIAFVSFDRATEPAVVAGNAAPGEVLVVGDVDLLEGTGLIAIRIGVPDDGGIKGSGSYYVEDLRNVLLLDRKAGTSRRIMPDNGTRIEAVRYFPAVAEGGALSEYSDDGSEEEAPAAYYLLTLERPLKNGDKVYDLLAGTLATGQQGIVMRGLSGVEQYSMLDATQLGIVVREGQTLYYRVIDIPALKQVESHKIEIG
jgi:hypothetical protein